MKGKLLTAAVALALGIGVCALPCGEAGTAAPETPSAPEVHASAAIDRSFAFDGELEGKAFVFFGDSITERCGLWYPKKDYIQLLQEEFGFYAYNAAKSGATLAVQPSSTNDFFTQFEAAKDIVADADYVSLFFGTNDFGVSRPLGTFTSKDKTTFCGALNCALDRILETAPNAKIMLLTPLYRGDRKDRPEENGAGNTLEEFRVCVREIGAAYGCKVVDLKDCFDETNEWKYMNPDMLHVYENGYRVIADTIKQQN